MSWPPTIGQTLPRANAAHGIEVKLRTYSLNTEHEVGSHKARVFRSALGTTLDDIDHLVEQLLDGVLVADAPRLVSAYRSPSSRSSTDLAMLR